MQRAVAAYQRFLDHLEVVSYFVAAVFTALLFINVSVSVIRNQISAHSFPWTPEVSQLLFGWMIFVGAGVIARSGGHIGVDLLYARVNDKTQAALRVVYALLGLIIAFVMVYYGYRIAVFTGQYQSSIYLNINRFYYYLSVPVGGILLGLFMIGTALPNPRTERKATQASELDQ